MVSFLKAQQKKCLNAFQWSTHFLMKLSSFLVMVKKKKQINQHIISLFVITFFKLCPEYAKKNLSFGATIEPSNKEIQLTSLVATERLKNRQPVLPFSLKKEKLHNVFLHCPTATLLHELRKKKDNFWNLLDKKSFHLFFLIN